MEFKDLLIEHDYYCSDSNYFSNDANCKWHTWKDFYNSWKDLDIDMNLIFRWDIYKRDDSESYWMEVFIMHQRKGVFAPHYIGNVNEQDLETIKELLSKHYKKIKKIWEPFK